MFRAEGISCIAMSLDDFYLSGNDQELLARSHATNSLLEFRGNGKTLVCGLRRENSLLFV
jgi:pantothenate kinase-related protein Tda10